MQLLIHKMTYFRSYIKENNLIYIIVALFIFANIAFLSFYNDVWWDSAVYIGMGKYIFSLGNSGLWESSRPLLLPLALGTGWAFNLNAVYFGKAISIIFAIFVIFITYKIGLKVFSKKIGLLAAFFTAFSYTFLFFSSSILTDIQSTFFVLLAFYYAINNRFFLTGLFSGIAIMTRFFQVFILVTLMLIFLFYNPKKHNFSKRLFYFVLGISIFILPYILLNYYLYKDIFLPFKVQTHLTKTTGWMLYKEGWFYFINLLKENFFLAFLTVIPFFFKKNYKFYSLALIPITYIIIFSFVKHKEMRFMLAVFPFLYLLTSYCLVCIYNKIKNKNLAFEFFSVILFAWLYMTYTAFTNVTYSSQINDGGLIHLQDYLKNSNGHIWITSPLYALYSDAEIDGLLYFYSSSNLIEFINKNKDDVDIVLFNSCDMPCPPYELDPLCKESRKVLENVLYKFEKTYQNEIGSCQYAIYKNTIS